MFSSVSLIIFSVLLWSCILNIITKLKKRGLYIMSVSIFLSTGLLRKSFKKNFVRQQFLSFQCILFIMKHIFCKVHGKCISYALAPNAKYNLYILSTRMFFEIMLNMFETNINKYLRNQSEK